MTTILVKYSICATTSNLTQPTYNNELPQNININDSMNQNYVITVWSTRGSCILMPPLSGKVLLEHVTNLCTSFSYWQAYFQHFTLKQVTFNKIITYKWHNFIHLPPPICYHQIIKTNDIKVIKHIPVIIWSTNPKSWGMKHVWLVQLIQTLNTFTLKMAMKCIYSFNSKNRLKK
jgi:hypothetical protein